MLATIADLFRAGAHWVAEGLMRFGRGFAAFVSRMRERYGGMLTANRSVLSEFWNLTRQAVNAAREIINGRRPTIGSIPIIPGELSRQRFRIQGIVGIKAPTIGDPENPLTADLPFVQESDKIKTLEEIAAEINQAIEQDILDAISGTPRGRKDRERAQYIRNRGEPIEYDIAPLFIWRIR